MVLLFVFWIVGEYGDHFQGDMVLTEEQRDEISSGISSYNGLIATKYRWPNKTVPYILSPNHSKQQQDYIVLSLKIIESVSCVKFVERTNENDYVQIAVSDWKWCNFFTNFVTFDEIICCCCGMTLPNCRQDQPAVTHLLDAYLVGNYWIFKGTILEKDASATAL